MKGGPEKESFRRFVRMRDFFFKLVLSIDETYTETEMSLFFHKKVINNSTRRLKQVEDIKENDTRRVSRTKMRSHVKSDCDDEEEIEGGEESERKVVINRSDTFINVDNKIAVPQCSTFTPNLTVSQPLQLPESARKIFIQQPDGTVVEMNFEKVVELTNTSSVVLPTFGDPFEPSERNLKPQSSSLPISHSSEMIIENNALTADNYDNQLPDVLISPTSIVQNSPGAVEEVLTSKTATENGNNSVGPVGVHESTLSNDKIEDPSYSYSCSNDDEMDNTDCESKCEDGDSKSASNGNSEMDSGGDDDCNLDVVLEHFSSVRFDCYRCHYNVCKNDL